MALLIVSVPLQLFGHWIAHSFSAISRSMTRKSAANPKAKLTDAERFKRFVDMAREVEASTAARKSGY
jgi:hypothetical protein